MTIKDVAAKAGVSAAAVSRYMNGGSLSEEKRKKIAAIIEETGYQPSETARGMRTGRQKQIAIIIPRIYSNAVSQVVEGVTSVVQEKGFRVGLSITDSDVGKELDFIELMALNQVSGIIVMGTTVTERQAEVYRDCPVPVVVTGQNIPGLNCVYNDDFLAAKEVTALVLARGRKHIAYIGADESDPAAGRARREGVVAACREAGYDTKDLIIGKSEFNADKAYEVMQRIFDMHEHVDGLIGASDTIALGAMRAFFDRGLEVSRDFSVTGIGDAWMCKYVQVPVTVAHLYHRRSGEEAGRMLLEMIEGKENRPNAVQLCIEHRIVERESI